MLYLANPSTPAARDAMAAGLLGAIMSPRQGNRLPDALFAIDNNCGPGKNGKPDSGYPGDNAYLDLLSALTDADDADPCDPDTSSCLFATSRTPQTLRSKPTTASSGPGCVTTPASPQPEPAGQLLLPFRWPIAA